MSKPRGGPQPWTLSWVHMALALALGAGLPLLWLVLAGPGRPVAAAVAVATKAEAAPGGAALVVALPTAEPAQGPAVTAATSTTTPTPAQAMASAQPPMPQIARVRDPNGDTSPDITDFINAGEVPTMAEVISRLHAAGVSSGLGAFNPPGTRPPLVGIAVTPDVELPAGYVRHHQFTDDGQPIEPILMFSPEHPLFAAANSGAVRPQDRVVPTALVPPGLPIRHIVVPPAGAGGNEPRSEPRSEPRK